MGSRVATDDEVETWRRDGWVLIEDLIGTDEVDAAADDLHQMFPGVDEYHADPQGVTERLKGRPAKPKEDYAWPDDGPGFRADQQRWMAAFPFAGSGRPTVSASIPRSSISPSGRSGRTTFVSTRRTRAPSTRV